MGYLTKRYFQRCKEEFTQMGFKRKKNSFVRVTNDVIQIFTLEISRGGYSCTISFESTPFCCGAPKGLGICGTFRIGWFDELRNTDGHWKYDPNDENNVNECVESMILSIKKYIITFFDRTTTPAAIFYESFFLEPSLSKKDRQKLFETNDYNKFCKINIFTDPLRYCIALKIKNYDFARWYLDKMLLLTERAYEETKDFVSEENRKKRESSIEALKKDIKMLELKEYDYFNEIVVSKEKEAKEFVNSTKLKNSLVGMTMNMLW